MRSPAPDLEAVAPDGEGEAPRPHPLGPRDVIQALSDSSRVVLTVVALLVVAVGAYLLGASRENPTILDAPRAVNGVLWHCGDRLVGVVNLGPGARLQRGTVMIEQGVRQYSAEVVTDEAGRVRLDEPAALAPAERLRVRFTSAAGAETQQLLVPVLSCAVP